MGEVIVDVSASVDGFVAGPGVGVDRPFGTAGHRLHRWLGFDGADPGEADRAAAERVVSGAGAVVLGRRMFDVGIGTWGPDGAFGRPTFVATHRGRDPLVRGTTTFTFVTGGVAAALERARETAGAEDVTVVGGAATIQQALASGLVTELRLHLVGVLLGGGTRLFDGPTVPVELERVGAVDTPHATHLTFCIPRQPATEAK
ncbi:MAG: dihydrofolate reductase family protein [Pseudonocardia sp.]